jgi:hypothetical protein
MRIALLTVAAALLRGTARSPEETRVEALSLLQSVVEPAKTEEPKAKEAKVEAAKPEAAKAAEPKAEKAAEPKAEKASKPEAAKAATKPEAKKAKKADPAHQKAVVDQLTKLAESLEANEKKIVEMDKAETNRTAHTNITASMKDSDKAMWENFDKWNHRMNEKTKVGSLDVISKIKHAVHFIKKGAMGGNDDAMKGLEDVIKSMGQMTR